AWVLTARAFGADLMLGESASDYVVQSGRDFSDRHFEAALADCDQAIALDPKCIKAYLARSDLRNSEDDPTGALADMKKAIELDPNSASSCSYYYNAGGVEYELDELSAARADFSRAITLNPNWGSPYIERGLVELEQGNNTEGLADLEKGDNANQKLATKYGLFSAIAMGAKPTDSYDCAVRDKLLGDLNKALRECSNYIKMTALPLAKSYALRGEMYYGQGDFEAALPDLQKADEMLGREQLEPMPNGVRDYNQMRIWLTRARLKDLKGANDELTEYLSDRLPIPNGDWPGSLLKFLTGQKSEVDLLLETKTDDPAIVRLRICEACYYIGARRLLSGDKAAAIEDFKRCESTSVRSYNEYNLAKAELRRLDPAQ
ncbi:MAG TPA: hypothetical protein VHY09_11835, partial [Candidatus Methylacidiphilales bacterium]|nr:hypothetical protein [Candidatus Methylacidiphilales bacterium]